jgi:hypothetical protein
MIERHVGDISKPVYYLAGPSAIKQAGVKSESIRAEMFAGY